MSIFCSVSFHQNAWTVLPSWDNRLSKSETNKPRHQFEIEMIESNVRRTLTWQEHWTYGATILLSRRRVQRIITPKILRIVRAVHFKLQQIITSQVLDKLDERRINLQKQNAKPCKTCDVWCDVTQSKVTRTLPRIMLMLISIISLVEKHHMMHVMSHFCFTLHWASVDRLKEEVRSFVS